jgi:pimeloyl-ACP methyl ester carboxylesterase
MTGRINGSVRLAADGVELAGELVIPKQAVGLVVFAHGSGSSRLSPRNRRVASSLNEDGLATLLFDLLTEEEAADRANVFDIDLLARRLLGAVKDAGRLAAPGKLPVGLFGASTGAAAALIAAAQGREAVGAVVSRGGRPDLASGYLEQVRAPTLLIVGGRDHQVLELNRWAESQMRCTVELVIVMGATHLFEEPGTLEEVSGLASRWFRRHLAAG